MLLDLVSPWATAVETNAPGDPLAPHAALLEQLRAIHAPHLAALPLTRDPARLRTLRAAIAGPGPAAIMTRLAAAGAPFGAEPCDLVAVPADTLLDPFTAVPTPVPFIALHEGGTPATMSIRLARDLGLLIRWRGTADGQAGSRTWSPWDRARHVPLGEWIHAHGMAWHVAAALHPELPPHHLFGVSLGAWQRLRERESTLREALLAALAQRGMAPLLRWLPADGQAGPPEAGQAPIPPRAGHYLAWRLTAPRVRRLGLADALHAAP